MSALKTYCPYLKRLESDIHYPIQGYCQRSSACELRVPSIAEFRSFCTTKDYHRCSIYRFGREAFLCQRPLPESK